MDERNRVAEFVALEAADEKKRADLAWLKEGKGRRLVDGQRLESEAVLAEQAREKAAAAPPERAAETPDAQRRREAREEKFNAWITESRDVLDQWAKEYAKIVQGGFLLRDGTPDYTRFDHSFIDRVQEELAAMMPSESELTGRETRQELLGRAARDRANELLAAARVLDSIQKTIEFNVKQWKSEGLRVIDDSADWRKVA